MKRRPKKFLNNSNKMLTALVCILAVVCLVAGGIYIDTFHGQGRFLALIGKTNRTQAQEEDTAVQEDTPKESVAAVRRLSLHLERNFCFARRMA